MSPVLCVKSGFQSSVKHCHNNGFTQSQNKVFIFSLLFYSSIALVRALVHTLDGCVLIKPTVYGNIDDMNQISDCL